MKMAVFWVVAPCSKDLWNVGKLLPDYNPEDSYLQLYINVYSPKLFLRTLTRFQNRTIPQPRLMMATYCNLSHYIPWMRYTEYNEHNNADHEARTSSHTAQLRVSALYLLLDIITQIGNVQSFCFPSPPAPIIWIDYRTEYQFMFFVPNKDALNLERN
jgi:hypothetical protein